MNRKESQQQMKGSLTAVETSMTEKIFAKKLTNIEYLVNNVQKKVIDISSKNISKNSQSFMIDKKN